MSQKVTILMGIPGSGKTTYRAIKYPDSHVCSADKFFTDDTGHYVFDRKKLGQAHADCLRDYIWNVSALGHRHLVVDNTNTTLDQVAPYVAVARAWDCDLEVLALTETELDECIRRGVHDVPDRTVIHMAQQLSRTLSYWPDRWPKPRYV